jgi:hypothetical protein
LERRLSVHSLTLATVSSAVNAPENLISPGTPRRAQLRLLASLAAFGLGAAAVVVGVLVVRGLAPIASTAPASVPTTTASSPVAVAHPTAPAGYPTPPANAVVLGARAGLDVLGLSVVPGHGETTLQASVVGEQGNGVKGLSVSFDVAGATGKASTVSGAPCGAGCYAAKASIGQPRSVGVRIGRALPVSFALPAAWPPPAAAAIVTRAAAAWRNLRSLVIRDSLGDGHIVLHTVWQIVAPDRIAYQIAAGGGDAVLIGNRRWDKPAGSTHWLASPQFPVQQPVPFWQSQTNARLLGTVRADGRPAWEVSFFDPETPGWFTIVVDKATLRTEEMSMIASAHFMHETYSEFNAPISITPPA